MAISDVDKDVPAIPMDEDGMHQVLINLLSNSLDAMHSRVGANARPGLIRINCKYDAEANECQIDVIDNGSGIEASMMRHLFELFHSTKGNRGTGLGLAVAKKIVEEHGGTIGASSKPGEGTTMSIKLPVYKVATGDPSSTHGGVPG